MPVATTRLVSNLLVLIVHSGAPKLIRIILESDGAVVADQRVPFGNDTGVFDTLIVGGGTVIVNVVDAEAPPAVLPQGAVPFGVVGFCVVALETIRERGALALMSLTLRDGTCFEAVFSFDVAPLVFRWSLSGEDAG